MNAVVELRRDVRIFHFVFRRNRGVGVAVRAGTRQVEFKDGRIGGLDGLNVVRAVAIPAIRRRRSAEVMAHAVNAAGVFLRGLLVLRVFLVAGGAVRRRQMALVLKFFNPDVTFRAVQFRVNRFRENICWKEKRDFLAIHATHCGGIGMTIQAVLSSDDFRRENRDVTQQEYWKEQKTPSPTKQSCGSPIRSPTKNANATTHRYGSRCICNLGHNPPRDA